MKTHALNSTLYFIANGKLRADFNASDLITNVTLHMSSKF